MDTINPTTMAVVQGIVALLVGGTAWMLILGLWNVYEHQMAQMEALEAAGQLSSSPAALRRLGMWNQRLLWPGYVAYVARRLVTAGNPRGYAPHDIMSLQEIGLFLGLLLGIFLMNAADASVGWALACAAVGGAYPLFWLNDQVTRRHIQIGRALPFHLDLLTLSVEAGLDFTAALARVVEKGKPGPLREELDLVLKQLKMGKTREEALKAMMDRVSYAPISSFVSALVQADRMRTSIGKVLRVQATQLRIERTQRAEKLANEAPVKMLFPLVACFFPTMFLILFGPIVFRFMYGNVAGG